MDRTVFPEDVVITDLYTAGAVRPIRQVLRESADDAPIANRVAGTDLYLAHNDGVRLDFGSCPDGHRPFNHDVWSDFHVGPEFGARVDDSGRMNHGARIRNDRWQMTNDRWRWLIS